MFAASQILDKGESALRFTAFFLSSAVLVMGGLWRVHRSSQFLLASHFVQNSGFGMRLEGQGCQVSNRENIMRAIGLVAIAITGLSLSGCSQISNVFKKKPHYHTDDGTVVYTGAENSLRTAPQQPYQFAEQSYDVDIYDSASQYSAHTSVPQYTSISQYAGYEVELYGAQPSYSVSALTDPRDAEFVSLNGESEAADWRHCEAINRGYLFISEYDFSLNPGFEVCMRNKGYVLSSEYFAGSKQTLTAQSAGLRLSLIHI